MSTAGDEMPGKKPNAKVLQVPRRIGRTSAAMADFLVDKSEYVLGIEPDGQRSLKDLRVRLELFTQSVREARLATTALALAAVESFLESHEERRRAIERISMDRYKSNDLFAFEHYGRLVHDLPEVQAYFSRSRRGTAKGGSQCLICGSMGDVVDKHARVKMPGGTPRALRWLVSTRTLLSRMDFRGIRMLQCAAIALTRIRRH